MGRRSKGRTRTVYSEALGREVVMQGVPLAEFVAPVAPGEPAASQGEIGHPCIARLIARCAVDPAITSDVVDGLDDAARHVLLGAAIAAHPETRRRYSQLWQEEWR